MPDEQFFDVLKRSADFLHRQGVGEGAAAVDEAIRRLRSMDAMSATLEDVTDRLHAADALYGRCTAVAEGRVRGDLGPYLQPVLDAYATSSTVPDGSERP